MHDIRSTLGRLRRPPLLVRAARIGAQGYDRETHLARLLGPGALPEPPAALARLIGIESALEEARRARSVAWRAARHVDVLIAVMGEAALLEAAAPAPPAQPKASGIDSLRLAT